MREPVEPPPTASPTPLAAVASSKGLYVEGKDPCCACRRDQRDGGVLATARPALSAELMRLCGRRVARVTRTGRRAARHIGGACKQAGAMVATGTYPAVRLGRAKTGQRDATLFEAVKAGEKRVLVARRKGKFEQADGGTMFLEVDALSLRIKALEGEVEFYKRETETLKARSYPVLAP